MIVTHLVTGASVSASRQKRLVVQSTTKHRFWSGMVARYRVAIIIDTLYRASMERHTGLVDCYALVAGVWGREPPRGSGNWQSLCPVGA